ncbi:MAG TPA: hypothetical protein DDW52_23915 [Planctomycetaceae bacterium]|nr:hypothetical protein [Planctomycetaceae bacterium]
MSHHSRIEQAIASGIGRFPALKRHAKSFYNYAQYAVRRKRGFSYEVLEETSLTQIGEHGEACFVGYFDNSPWSIDGRWFAFCRTASDSINLDVVLSDTSSGTKRVVSPSECWSLQQGARCHWLNLNGKDLLVFNKLQNGCLGAYFCAPETGETYWRPFPIQSAPKSGGTYASINYLRLTAAGSEYGYDIEATNFSHDMHTDEDGIWLCNAQANEASLLVSLKQCIEFNPIAYYWDGVHFLNHVTFSPNGKRLVFVHRIESRHGRYTRLFATDCSGRNIGQLTLCTDDGYVSHYCWLDNDRLLVYGLTEPSRRGYFVINTHEQNGKKEHFHEISGFGDGHPSLHPGGEWIVTDTYPDRARQQHLVLLNLRTREKVVVGSFLSPLKFQHENRCDLHPRWSADGREISFDATHSGIRSTYMLNVASITGKA